MNTNQRAPRAVGRGALLQQLLLNASSINKGMCASSSSNSDESRSNISTSSESLVDSTKFSSPELDETLSSGYQSGGRGKLLQRILLANESICVDSFQTEAAPKPLRQYGMGRGRMLRELSEMNQPAETKLAEESIQTIDKGVDDLSIGSSELEPVIKRGTKG